jgi:sRNA-binding protein
VSYWVLLTAGTPRVDLDGNVAGEVTIEDEQDAQQKIAKAYRRTAAKGSRTARRRNRRRRVRSAESPIRPLTSQPSGRRQGPRDSLASACPGLRQRLRRRRREAEPMNAEQSGRSLPRPKENGLRPWNQRRSFVTSHSRSCPSAVPRRGGRGAFKRGRNRQ